MEHLDIVKLVAQELELPEKEVLHSMNKIFSKKYRGIGFYVNRFSTIVIPAFLTIKPKKPKGRFRILLKVKQNKSRINRRYRNKCKKKNAKEIQQKKEERENKAIWAKVDRRLKKNAWTREYNLKKKQEKTNN